MQGRYDVVCSTQPAYDLHKAWPESKFIWIPDAGHSAEVSKEQHLQGGPDMCSGPIANVTSRRYQPTRYWSVCAINMRIYEPRSYSTHKKIIRLT